MIREHCEVCGQPIRNIDFYLAIKGGVICPTCMLTQRTARFADRQDADTAARYADIPANQMSVERQLFF
ncbi:MAG: hypothetical protein KKB70_00555 [Proteobacteria bacterium]|nr:hypothetical protein [Pseudomonadota bacterium]MBU1610847.1 hypothetical protein [Pseudomonadota bacterium]